MPLKVMADWSVTNESRGLSRVLLCHERVDARQINSGVGAGMKTLGTIATVGAVIAIGVAAWHVAAICAVIALVICGGQTL